MRVVKRIRGDVLAIALENAACDIIDGRFVQVSGLAFSVDPRRPVDGPHANARRGGRRVYHRWGPPNRESPHKGGLNPNVSDGTGTDNVRWPTCILIAIERGERTPADSLSRSSDTPETRFAHRLCDRSISCSASEELWATRLHLQCLHLPVIIR